MSTDSAISGRIVRPVFAFLSISLLFASSFSQPQQPQKLNVAVLDFDARAGMSKDEAVSLSDVFSTQLVKSGEFVVIDRSRIKEILQEQGFQQSEACSQLECIVEAGKILKVQKMFAGTIGKVGKVYTVAIQIIDVETAQIQHVEEGQHEGDVEDLVYEVVPTLASRMIKKLTDKDFKPEIASRGSSWYWYVGGAVLVGGGAAVLLLKQKAGTTTAGTTTADETLLGPPRLP